MWTGDDDGAAQVTSYRAAARPWENGARTLPSLVSSFDYYFQQY